MFHSHHPICKPLENSPKCLHSFSHVVRMAVSWVYNYRCMLTVYVLSGNSAKLPCSANTTSANPRQGVPVSRQWTAVTPGALPTDRRDLKALTNSQTGSLELTSVQGSDIGSYSCKLSWTDDRGVKEQVTFSHKLRGRPTQQSFFLHAHTTDITYSAIIWQTDCCIYTDRLVILNHSDFRILIVFFSQDLQYERV